MKTCKTWTKQNKPKSVTKIVHILKKKPNKRNKMMNNTNFFRPLKLQQIVKNDIKIYQFVNTSTASSWNKYKKRFFLDLGGLIIIADRKHTSNKKKNVVVVKCISSSKNSDKLRMIDRIQHENLFWVLRFRQIILLRISEPRCLFGRNCNVSKLFHKNRINCHSWTNTF